MDVEDLLQQSPNGVATWAQLRPYVSREQLAAAVGTGRVKRAGRGTYRLAASSPDYGVAAALHGTLSHLSAAQHHGLALIRDPTRTHVTVRANRGAVKVPKNVRIFYRDVPSEQVTDGITDVLRTVLDCARDCPIPDALAVADSALRYQKADRDDLVTAASELRGPKSKGVQQMVQWADARAASVMESALRGLLCEASLPIFEPQFPIKVSTGDVWHPDLGHAASRVVIEADSVLNHGGPAKLEFDTYRYDEFAAAGYVVLRFMWKQITKRPDWVVEMVRRTLRQRGWT